VKKGAETHPKRADFRTNDTLDVQGQGACASCSQVAVGSGGFERAVAQTGCDLIMPSNIHPAIASLAPAL
jgi:hypothetical protein